MSHIISFYKVKNNTVNTNSRVYIIQGSRINSHEIREKARELFNRYSCNGILVINIKQNIYGETVGGNEMIYDGNKFSRDTLNIRFLNVFSNKI